MKQAQGAEDILALYEERSESFRAEATRLRNKYNRFSIVRLVAFFGGIALLILLYQQAWWIGMLATVVLLLGFYRFMIWHLGVKREEEHQRALAQVNEQEAAVMDHDFHFFADGVEYVDPQHPYAVDLDIFGPFSFFQYTNRTNTAIGARALAGALQAAAPAEVLVGRQRAIAALVPDLEWRQHFQAHGIRTEDTLGYIERLHAWIQQEPFVLPKRWLRILLSVLPVLTIAGVAVTLYQGQFWGSILCVLPAGLLLRQFVMQVNRVHEQTSQAEKTLSFYARLIEHIEKQNFHTEYLQQQQAAFGGQASTAIRRLSYIISQLNVRYNVFSIFLNLLGLWDLQWVYRLERWKRDQRESLPAWFEALAEFEVLNSLATTAYNNPDWCFPEFEAGASVSAEALGHPLLNRAKRVSNDVELPTRAHIKLLTGSNMAGKSTFLRTVGLNIVLAMTGAPVCARKMRLPRLRVYTSMRTQDALHESTSSFYAELKRLKVIIEAVESRDDVFFLLDEILKGTNSKDRHTGSEALIRQFIRQAGAGIIATHDLELGKLESQYEGEMENWCMEVQIEKGELFFDYKLRRGLSQSFNATLLMQQMGIRIENQEK